jgi:Tol biopolymer transport system component
MARNGAPLRYPLSGDMTKTPERTPQGSAPMERRLDSWKEIASFLGRGIRTVQRWEREEGLPVRRLAHAQRGSVFADPTDLSAWWERRQIKPGPKPATGPDTASAPQLQRVTTTTTTTVWPVLSSDARMVVYVSDVGKAGATPQVWLQQIGGAAVQLTTGLRDCAEPAFSADDTRVIFSAIGESTRNVYELPTLGGPLRILKRAARNARFSPDGKWLTYISLEPRDAIRLASTGGGSEQSLTSGLVDIAFVTWSDDSCHVLVLAHPNPSVDLDYWIVPVAGGAAIDTGVLRRARQRGLRIVSMPPAWSGDSVFYSAVGRHGLHVWRQRISAATFEPTSEPELMTPGAEHSFYPAAAGGKLSFLGTHADTNLWSVAIDATAGTTSGPLRRLTRGAGIVNHLTLSRDGRSLAYFAARSIRGELHVRELESGVDTMVGGDIADRWFPTISPNGEQIAYGTIVTGPPVQRPLFLTSLADGETQLVRHDCGGRPRQWLDARTLLVETFGAGLNSFVVVETHTGAQRPLLSSSTHGVSNPRVSPDGRWLAFDAAHPGGSPAVAVARIEHIASNEAEWVTVQVSASHPFWSRDGHLLYYLPTTPSLDFRNRIAARRFDPSTGHIDSEAIDVLTLSEMFVPAMLPGIAPIVAPDQIIFVLGDYRGDVWMMDV